MNLQEESSLLKSQVMFYEAKMSKINSILANVIDIIEKRGEIVLTFNKDEAQSYAEALYFVRRGDNVR